MIQLILFIIAIAIIFAILKKSAKYLLYAIGGTLGLAISVVSGVQFALGYLTELIARKTGSRQFILALMMVTTVILAVSFTFFDAHPSYGSYEFISWRFFISSVLLFSCLVASMNFTELFKLRDDFSVGKEKEKLFYFLAFSSFFISTSCTTLFTLKGFNFFDSGIINFIDHSLWAVSIIAIFGVLAIPSELLKTVKKYESVFDSNDKVYLSVLNDVLEEDLNLIKDDLKEILNNLISIDVINNKITEIDFKNDSLIFTKSSYEKLLNDFREEIKSEIKLDRGTLSAKTCQIFDISIEESNEYIDLYVEDGHFFNFEEGPRFVSYFNTNKIRSCVCCGFTESSNDDDGNWICSEICEETEKYCDEIKLKPYKEFLNEASTSGFIVMAGAYAWSENHKIVNPTSDTGHGFAAERANNFADKIKGKNASIVGDDNAKNGADRLVDGNMIQTKYCRTALKSVNQSFDNSGSGNYRYLDANGKPMQLEVPKDQYEAAVSAMEEKIKQGKVPGVSDPNEARKIVIKGSITYEQARNITKFCTVESLTFDVIEGAVVSASAAGISFTITASIYYLNTKDPEKAIQTAALQAGKTFSSTLVVYVSTQQLHRLKPVVSLLNKIDVKHLPKSARDFLASGYGVKSSSLNKAVRGTVVTCAVVIAVSTGPDLVKMIRGRISGGQFLQNLSVVSSGVVAGTVGSIAGAAIFSPLGPAAAFGGRIIGGFIGGHIGSFIATKIAGKLREDDKTQMIKVITAQIEFLAITFNLTSDELNNVQSNLQKVVNDEMLEKLYAAKSNRIPYANFCIKPIVVAVVKQRPSLRMDDEILINSIQNLAA